MSYLSILGMEFQKPFIIIKINTHKFAQLQSLVEKHKSLSLVLKRPYLGILRLKFENNIAISEISTLVFV